MTKSLYTLILFALLSLAAHADIESPPHIGPEGLRFSKIHTYKVEKLVRNQLSNKDLNANETSELQNIEMLLNVGKKASKWIELVNTKRDPASQLDLSSPTKSGGIPITAPQRSSTEIMLKRYNDFLESAPVAITSIIKSNQNLPTSIPEEVSSEEFVKSLRVLDRIYQSTIRWASARNWLSYYTERATYDIRGFIFLKNTPDLEAKLKTFPAMSDEEKAIYTGWFLGLCRNGTFSANRCKTELLKHTTNNTLYSFYNQYKEYGQNVYDLLFTVKKTRKEIKWDAERVTLHSPFQTPDRSDVQKWLKENIEDEWRRPNFKLQINYKKTNEDIPKIQFKEGVTANVNGIAGNTITMEAEYPIETKDQKWTIRHEYGHVLGFQDCYLEFYDTNEKAIIYYEIDVDNLMCSRNGHLNSSHIEQLQIMYK